MSRNRHHRLRDHFGIDLDTAVILDGNVGDIPSGTTVHDALLMIASGGDDTGDLDLINWANPDIGTVVYYMAHDPVEILGSETLLSDSDGLGGAGGPLTPENPDRGNDGDHGTTTSRNSGVFVGAPNANYWWYCDFTDLAYVTLVHVDGHLGGDDWREPSTDTHIEYSDDGASWTETAHTYSLTTTDSGYSFPYPDEVARHVYTITTPSAHRYWRVRKNCATGVFVQGDAFGEMYIYGDIVPEWTLGPNIQDEDNATYHEVSAGPDVIRVELTDPLLMYEAIVRMAFPTTGERTYGFYGGNETDYSDLVLLDETTFAPIGGNTAQNITFDWIATTPYQYYYLSGPNENRRVHELTLHAILGQITTSHPLLTNRDVADQHPATAVSFDDTIAGLGEDDVQHAIEKLAANTTSGSGISAIISNTSVGVKFDWEMPFAGSISEVRLFADQTGSIVLDLWKDTYNNYPPTVADTICAAAKPTLSSASKYRDTTLTGWTTSFNVGDIIRVKVDSASTLTRVTLALRLERAAASPAVGSIQLGLIDRTAFIREPTVGHRFALGLITQTAAIYDPVVTGGA